MKVYAGLEKTVIARDQKAIEAELDKMFPPLPPLEKIDDAELGRRRAGAEAERQRWIEIERQKLEQEQLKKAIPGIYYHTSHGGMLTADLRIEGVQAICNYRCTVCGYAVITYTASFAGNTVSLIGRAKHGDHCTFREYDLVENYSGAINNSGTVLTGYWHKNGVTVPVTFYKR
jgi:hypothetical protein